MWRLVRAGLRIYRPVLLQAGWGTPVGIVVTFTVLCFCHVANRRQAVEWAALALPVYLLLTSAVVGWIALGADLAEHRLRLHLLLPLPESEVAVAQCVLPLVPLLLGLVIAHTATAAAAAAYGGKALWVGHAVLDVIASHLFFLQQITLAVAAAFMHRARRGETLRAVLAVLLLIAGENVLGLVHGLVWLRVAAMTCVGLATTALTLALLRRPGRAA